MFLEGCQATKVTDYCGIIVAYNSVVYS